MEWLTAQLQPLFQWLLRSTLQVGAVICLILLLQVALGRKLGIRWHNSLWLLLLICMVMPWKPQSPASLFNLMPRSLRRAERVYFQPEVRGDVAMPGAPTRETTASAESKPTLAAPVAERTTEPVTAAPITRKREIRPPKSAPIQIRELLLLIWLAGALVLGVYVFASNFKLWKIVRGQRPSTDRKTLDLLEDCKAQMGIRTILGLVVTDKVKSPALFGFVRPRLLLPERMVQTLSREELRYVFLHELAHLKRFDIYQGWLMSLLQVLHCFNPLVWLAFHRMRSDRELACDALVLSRTESRDPQAYGRTIVDLLDRFSRAQRLPGMAGILETKSRLKRRITMIARFKKKSYKWSPLGAGLLIVLGCASLLEAENGIPSDTSTAKPKAGMALRLVARGIESTYATISPDGKHLCDVIPWKGELYVRELGTGEKRVLVRPAHSGDWPAYLATSPDSKTVACRWYDSKKESYNLEVIGLDGSGRRVLCPGGLIAPMDWASDGKRILGIRPRPEDVETKTFPFVTQLVWVSTEDGSVQVVRTFPKHAPSLRPKSVELSPDGRYVAYQVEAAQRDGSSKHDILLLAIGEEREVPLVKHRADDRLLGWTPDGSAIMFTSDRTGTWDLWLLRVADGRPQGWPQMVYDSMGEVAPMGFTQNGAYYYGATYHTGNVYTTAVNLKTGKVLSPPEPVQHGLWGCPAWSPDGQYLAYCTQRTGERGSTIHIRSLATGEERVLAPDLPWIRCLIWSADGRSLLASHLTARFDTPQGWMRSVYQINAETGKSNPVLRSETGRVWQAELSPDAKSLVYSDLGEGGSRVLVRNLETGREKKSLSSSGDLPTGAAGTYHAMEGGWSFPALTPVRRPSSRLSLSKVRSLRTCFLRSGTGSVRLHGPPTPKPFSSWFKGITGTASCGRFPLRAENHESSSPRQNSGTCVHVSACIQTDSVSRLSHPEVKDSFG